jgi:hypothetical protein
MSRKLRATETKERTRHVADPSRYPKSDTTRRWVKVLVIVALVVVLLVVVMMVAGGGGHGPGRHL